MMRSMLIALLSLVASSSCFPDNQPIDLKSLFSQYGVVVVVVCLALFCLGFYAGMCFTLAVLEERMGSEKFATMFGGECSEEFSEAGDEESDDEEEEEVEELNNEPTTCDTGMFSFMCGCLVIFQSLGIFTKDKNEYINSLDNFFGKDADIVYFYKYIVKLTENGLDVCYKFGDRYVDKISVEEEDIILDEIREKNSIVLDNLDFVEAVGKIVEHVEKYLEEQKEFIDKLTTDDKDAMKVLKKLEQLVKNGKDFVDSFNDNHAAADSDNTDQIDTKSETHTADSDNADNTLTDNFVVV